MWEKCAELKLPVNAHIADHPSCWKPLGPKQERTPDFQHFNQYGKDVLSYEELLATRGRLLKKHPRLTLIACHLGNQGNDLVSLAAELDRYPNLYVDISARDYEIGRDHGLPELTVIGADGHMNDAAGELAGLSQEEADRHVLAWLEEHGQLERRESYRQRALPLSR